MIYVSKNEAFCCEVETRFGSSPLARFERKNSWYNFTTYVSKNKAVRLWRILEVICLQGIQKNSGHIFMIYMLKNEAFCCEVETHFGSSPLARFTEKNLGPFLWFMCPNTKLFAMKFRRFVEVLHLQGLQEKILGAVSRFMCPKTKLFAVKLRCIWKLSACKVYRINSGCIFMIYVFKNEAVCCEVETHLEVNCLQGLQE